MQNAAWGRVYRGLDRSVTDRVGFIAANGLYSYASTQTIDFFYRWPWCWCWSRCGRCIRRFGAAYAALILITVLPPMAAGGIAVDGTSDVGLVPGVPLAGRGRA